ncbi:NAD(P)/FAD-dependent oxidoreductase [Cytophaga aurantiaca]|uniref:NAD(P)/FAD-dependent oxidoreductase n=1 Tax=Cytophaga aurantiaca TaxID=29530 RepID=UPI000374E8C7|nr:NAD(P)/FAD-dependent oxidoreductase [Cytophaga aurantiaca]
MEINNNSYRCAIVGGGVAGLSLAIQLADAGIEVIVFEKNTYPFHKVCGEYISMESWNFLLSLGLPLNDMNLPSITQLGVSSEKGFMLNAPLDLGGFGISRYTLDQELCLLAKAKGVVILENCKVLDVENENEHSSLITTTFGLYRAQIVCGSYGKYTPVFAKSSTESKKKNINYIGVKYHIKTDFPDNRIELHNYEDGYCGISKVDKETYCMCYLSTSDKLKQSENNIKQLEETVLHKNPFLKRIFLEAEFIFKEPIVISNISFHKKSAYANGIFLVGDAAGSITPLCGNGMSMGFRASFVLSRLLVSFFRTKTSKTALIEAYQDAWNNEFNFRIQTGYYLQSLFGKKTTTHLVLKTLDKFPAVTQKIIGLTHGKPF